jgi:hypothetical protein
MDMQITALPRPRALLFLADAAAIKVSLLSIGTDFFNVDP